MCGPAGCSATPAPDLLFATSSRTSPAIVAVQTSLALAWSILAEASLSFLGLGPPPPTASLGEMVSNSSALAATAWWTLAMPSIAIVIAVIGFNFLGDGLRDAVDPRARTTVRGDLHACDRDDLRHFLRRRRGALAEIDIDGESLVGDLVEHRSVPYPPSVHGDIAAMLPPGCDLDRAGVPARRGDRAVLRRGRRSARRHARKAWTPSALTARPSTTGWKATRRRGPAAGRAGVDRRAHRRQPS